MINWIPITKNKSWHLEVDKEVFFKDTHDDHHGGFLVDLHGFSTIFQDDFSPYSNGFSTIFHTNTHHGGS
jgi:hypothetical protein